MNENQICFKAERNDLDKKNKRLIVQMRSYKQNLNAQKLEDALNRQQKYV